MGLVMHWGSFFRVLFIIYCIEAGVFLVLAPWSPGWDLALLHFPFSSFYLVGIHPILRGMISGFGLIHLVWGAHDLESLLARRSSRALAA